MSDDSDSVEPGPMEPAQKAAAAFSRSTGALIVIVFGISWLGWGFSAARTFPVKRWLIFDFASLVMLAASVQSLRRGKALMRTHAVTRKEYWAGKGKQFRLITALEGVGGGIVVLLAIVFHRLDLLPAGVSLVVGIHFLPLARLFRFPAYYITGLAIIFCDLLSLALLRSNAITVSVGVSTGCVLWITGVYALLCSRRLLA